jgi:hypothetical protein
MRIATTRAQFAQFFGESLKSIQSLKECASDLFFELPYLPPNEGPVARHCKRRIIRYLTCH